ncbi:hypothetical protein D3C87_1641840 [compost metagenome]
MRVEVQRRMQCATAAGHLLGLFDAVADVDEMLGGWQGNRIENLQFRQCLLQRFHTAQPTATGAGHLSTMILQRPERAAGNLHIGLHRLIEMAEAQVVDFALVLDDVVADAETTDEVFEVAGRHHHHCLTQTVVGDRQGNLRRQRCLTDCRATVVLAKVDIQWFWGRSVGITSINGLFNLAQHGKNLEALN